MLVLLMVFQQKEHYQVKKVQIFSKINKEYKIIICSPQRGTNVNQLDHNL